MDEIIEQYLNPCNEKIWAIKKHSKFIEDEQAVIEKIVEKQKEKSPKFIPYRFGCFAEYPQFIMLIYMFKPKKIEREHIKIKPDGLHFHNKAFQNLEDLIRFFKSNFRKEEYQKNKKKAKAPRMISG